MTRTYIAKRLLEHGALNFREFVEITGWPSRKCTRTLDHMKQTGMARLDNGKWTLTEVYE